MVRCEKCGAEIVEADRLNRPTWESELGNIGRVVQGTPKAADLCEECHREALLFGAAVLGQPGGPCR